jgi:hypothetical protein
MHQNHLTKGSLVLWNKVPAVIEVWWWHPAHSYAWRVCSSQPLGCPQRTHKQIHLATSALSRLEGSAFHPKSAVAIPKNL